MTFAGCLRATGGGTWGGLVNTALIGSPCGGPRSPRADPPVSVESTTFRSAPALPSQPAASTTIIARLSHLIIECLPVADCAGSSITQPYRTASVCSEYRGLAPGISENTNVVWHRLPSPMPDMSRTETNPSPRASFARFAYGFTPLFLAAGAYAVVGIGLWLWM